MTKYYSGPNLETVELTEPFNGHKEFGNSIFELNPRKLK